MVNNLLLKESDEELSCPDCFNKTTHHIHKNESVPHNNEINEIGGIIAEKDPFRYFENLPIETQKGKMLVAFICRSSKTGNDSEPAKFISMLDDKKGAVCEKDEDNLVDILSLLRCAILFDAVEEEKQSPEINCMNDFHWKKDVFADNRAVTKYYYAFCMGGVDLIVDKQIAKNDVEIKSKILANRVIVEIAMRLVNKFRSMPFQRMIGQYLSTVPHTSRLHKLLTGLRLSVHIQTVRDHVTAREIKIVSKGKRLDPKGFSSSVVDNCEYSSHMKT